MAIFNQLSHETDGELSVNMAFHNSILPILMFTRFGKLVKQDPIRHNERSLRRYSWILFSRRSQTRNQTRVYRWLQATILMSDVSNNSSDKCSLIIKFIKF
jgi:hypothetical protein